MTCDLRLVAATASMRRKVMLQLQLQLLLVARCLLLVGWNLECVALILDGWSILSRCYIFRDRVGPAGNVRSTVPDTPYSVHLYFTYSGDSPYHIHRYSKYHVLPVAVQVAAAECGDFKSES